VRQRTYLCDGCGGAGIRGGLIEAGGQRRARDRAGEGERCYIPLQPSSEMRIPGVGGALHARRDAR